MYSTSARIVRPPATATIPADDNSLQTQGSLYFLLHGGCPRFILWYADPHKAALPREGEHSGYFGLRDIDQPPNLGLR